MSNQPDVDNSPCERVSIPVFDNDDTHLVFDTFKMESGVFGYAAIDPSRPQGQQMLFSGSGFPTRVKALMHAVTTSTWWPK